MSSVTGIRVASAVVLFLATIISGLMPPLLFTYWNHRKSKSDPTSSSPKKTSKKYKSIMSILMFFGGGVLLATCFVHLIPEVRENLNHYFQHQQELAAASRTSAATDNLHHDHHHHDDDDEVGHDHDHDSDHNGSAPTITDDGLTTTISPTTLNPLSLVELADTNSRRVQPPPNDHHEEDDHDEHPDHEGHSHSPKAEALHSHDHGESGHNHGLPYVELAVCFGFFVIYLLEEIVHTFIGHDHHSEDMTESITSSSEDLRSMSNVSFSSSGVKYPPPTSESGATTSPNNQPGGGMVIDLSSSHLTSSKGYDNYAIDINDDRVIVLPTSHVVSTNPNHLNGLPVTPPETPATPESPGAGPPLFGRGQSCDQLVKSRQHPLKAISSTSSSSTISDFKSPTSVRFLQGLMVIVAFSAHSIFDGVAIGVQEESTRIWTMFFAICSHKLVVALAVGMELFEKTKSLVMTFGLMAIFSSMSPVGIFLVILTESRVSGNDSPVIILLQAVATGTILYIVFFEVLQRDRHEGQSSTYKFFGLVNYLAMIVGFAVMFALTIYVVH